MPKTTFACVYEILRNLKRSKGYTRLGNIEDIRVRIEGLRNQVGLDADHQISTELDAAVAAADTFVDRILASRSAAQAAAAQAAAADKERFSGVDDDDDFDDAGWGCIVS